jgi:hypothetical protein
MDIAIDGLIDKIHAIDERVHALEKRSKKKKHTQNKRQKSPKRISLALLFSVCANIICLYKLR